MNLNETATKGQAEKNMASEQHLHGFEMYEEAFPAEGDIDINEQEDTVRALDFGSHTAPAMLATRARPSGDALSLGPQLDKPYEVLSGSGTKRSIFDFAVPLVLHV